MNQITSKFIITLSFLLASAYEPKHLKDRRHHEFSQELYIPCLQNRQKKLQSYEDVMPYSPLKVD
jgi:hypothetical protein